MWSVSLIFNIFFTLFSQTHHHSSHTVTGHHTSGTSQSDHMDAKYSDNVNGHDTLTDFVTFVCQETDNSPQSSQVNWTTLQVISLHDFMCMKTVRYSLPYSHNV